MDTSISRLLHKVRSSARHERLQPKAENYHGAEKFWALLRCKTSLDKNAHQTFRLKQSCCYLHDRHLQTGSCSVLDRKFVIVSNLGALPAISRFSVREWKTLYSRSWQLPLSKMSSRSVPVDLVLICPISYYLPFFFFGCPAGIRVKSLTVWGNAKIAPPWSTRPTSG